MAPLSLLEQAKDGDAAAIATLMNQALQPKGITVRCDRQSDCLQLWLTGQTLPPQAATVSYVRRGLERLQVTSITILQIYAEQADQQEPGWGVEVDLSAAAGEVRQLTLESEFDRQPEESEDLTESVAKSEPLAPGTIAYAYALLGLEQGDSLKKVEDVYFKLKAQTLREGDRAKVEDLKQAFRQLKEYIENPPQQQAEEASGETEAPVLTSQDESLPAVERVEALLKERGVAAQVSTQGSQLNISWLAVRVINPEDAANQVQTLLTHQTLASLGLSGIESLVFSGLSRDQAVVWQQTSPLIKR
ncbi:MULTISPECIES: hypothetical protein [Cyanophyceae]|uniref:hypothetical protein n=1 Tax=Cyanophyceae TaxID=3028117 RepID=UPI0016841E1D|nr:MULTISPECIES: hypothetical protein [Cyanophyceae]MBD1914859.1 hypothetical protein [Phormidium sp. FACHB-77]MBD2031023.1 hypothetical protein [Phormidium sp. FACHB-322]MBD2052630.1 hypothetical protein [Leptolyngbya sp. FACHB-60]